jgi:hypothetical protein
MKRLWSFIIVDPFFKWWTGGGLSPVAWTAWTGQLIYDIDLASGMTSKISTCLLDAENTVSCGVITASSRQRHRGAVRR